MASANDIAHLLAIMEALRTPQTGCPWDLEQSFETIAPYTLEEAYEVADAISRGDMADLQEELGDLLFQVVFHARLAEEVGHFSFDDVVGSISEKLTRRHPHVFGEARQLSPNEVKGIWARIKAEEKRLKADKRAAAGLPPKEEEKGVLGGIALPLPAMTRALKLQEKASSVGFDWNDAHAVLAKIREETDEVEEALSEGGPEAIREEIGDLLFAVVNLARHAGVEPERALRGTNEKFTRRFRYIEQMLEAENRAPEVASLEEMEALWQQAKRQES
ncbi:nucleoside triphosphate pyrophosphohydrolase [Xanthobacter sp. TB0139]|uniref:nucleoside triphosphate pyrophosphohydrolase n=1 Tax=Xanthobacter sp. TB0139 TaxID=3459178 RepID=UPI004039BC8D